MVDGPIDVAKGHRWFAVACNNEAWDLLEKESRTEAESRRMVHLAHAACLHWLEAGGALEEQRAMYLLARVYAAIGSGEGAMRYAERGMALSESAGGEQSVFDRACALEGMAAASRASGDEAGGARYGQLAAEAGRAIEDEGERAVFEGLLGM